MSLEVRVPFLLKINIEKAIDINPWLNYGNGKKKGILKQFLRKRCVGATIDDRKRGFTIPLKSWINQELKTNFEEVLFDRNFIQTFGFDELVIKNLMNAHSSGKDEKWPLFTLFALANWNKIRK